MAAKKLPVTDAETPQEKSDSIKVFAMVTRKFNEKLLQQARAENKTRPALIRAVMGAYIREKERERDSKYVKTELKKPAKS